MESTSYVADVNVTLAGTANPTVKKSPVDCWNIIKPESPGFTSKLDPPLINDVPCGANVKVPVPLFLNAINQPPVKLTDVGRLMVLLPDVQTNVLARLASVIVGGEDT